MAINSNDRPVDDDDTQDEVEIRDTERPPKRLDRDTVPDLTVEAAIAMRSRVVEIRDLSALPREEEIMARICADAGLQPHHLKNLRRSHSSGKLTFLECRAEGTSISYIYMTESHPAHDFVGKKNARFPLQNPGATVLLRVFMDGTSKEVYRWEKETGENE